MTDDERDLLALRLIQTRQEAGLRTLLEAYQKPLFHFIYRMVGSPDDAAELTQETFLRVWQKGDSFKLNARVKPWMYAIAANLCRDALRKRRRHPAPLSLDALDAQGERLHSDGDRVQASPADRLQHHEQTQTLLRAVHALPSSLKLPFVFCVLEGHTQEEAAETLGLSRKSVETRIRRARKRLQNIWELSQK